MWTLKSALLVDTGIVMLLLGIVLRNYQAVASAFALISFVAIAGYKSVCLRIDVQRSVSAEKVFEDHTVEVRLRVRNLGRRVEFLEVLDELPDTVEVVSGSNYLLLTLNSGEEFVLKYKFKCHLRGHYSLGPIRVRSRPLFGMFYTEEVIQKRAPLTVFPRIDDLTNVEIKPKYPKIFPGALAMRQVGPGTEFFSIREYVKGDELKKVNWKAYARMRKMMVNEYERENVSDVMIILDSREGEGVGTKLENPLAWGARAAAALASYFLRRRDAVGIAVYSDTVRIIPIESGVGRLFKILDELSAARPEGTAPLKGVIDLVKPHLSPNATVVLISTLSNDLTVRDAVRSLCVQHFDLIVLSPSDVEFESTVVSERGLSYHVLRLERENLLSEIRGYGARVVDWKPEVPLRNALSGLMS